MRRIANSIVFKQLSLLFLVMIALILSGIVSAEKTENNSAIQFQPDKPPIKIGMSTSLTGGAASSGKNMRLGVEIYFDKINAAGGIQGQKLKLITLDDGYEPLRAAANLHQLIDQEHVLAMLGNNGTPAAVVAVPIVNASKVLLFGARTGSELLRKTPPDRYVINLRASYFNEVNTLIKGLLASGIAPDNIAFFSQNDAFGDSIYLGGMKALKEQGYSKPEALPYGRYDRNSLDVAAALSRIMEQAKRPIKAFILGGVYGPNAQFIKLARTEYPDAIFLSVSGLVNASDLNKEMDGKVISSQVAPYLDSTLPAVVEYREDLKKYGGGAEPNTGSLEGYLAAKLFVMGLKQAAASNKLTREGIIDIFEKMNNINLGIGINVSFSKKDHTGLTTLWMTVFKNGKFIATDWPKHSTGLKY